MYTNKKPTIHTVYYQFEDGWGQDMHQDAYNVSSDSVEWVNYSVHQEEFWELESSLSKLWWAKKKDPKVADLIYGFAMDSLDMVLDNVFAGYGVVVDEIPYIGNIDDLINFYEYLKDEAGV